MEKSVLQFESPKHQSSFIKVIGVGGGGTNAANHMYNVGIQGVDFIICNTDDKSLDASPIPTKIKLGKSGLGAGNMPAVARERATEVGDEIKEMLSHNTQMLFITAGMGGGTGTGAAPVIARLAKEIQINDDVNEILVVAIVTLPFSFEGRRRRIQAEEGIQELRKYVDAILVINNDRLRDFGKMGLREAFSKADDILLTAAKGIAEIITVKSYINIDFRDVNTVMQKSGVALMGSGVAEGEDRALKAVEMATTSVLLNDNNINGAKNILLYLASGTKEIEMDEVWEITDYIHQEAGMDVDVIWGAGFDDTLGEQLSITLIATGFVSKDYDPPVDRVSATNNNTQNKAVEFEIKGNTSGSLFTLEDTLEEAPSKAVTEKEELPVNLEEPILLTSTNKSTNTNISLRDQLYKEEQQQTVVNSQQTTEDAPVLKPKEIPAFEEKRAEKPFLAEQAANYDEYVEQRAKRMKEVYAQLQTAQGIEKLEKTPAYELFGLSLKDPQHSSKTEISKMSLNGETENNSFIYDQPD